MTVSRVHFVEDQPASGAWNMAVDEFHLEYAAEHALPVFRLYRWTPGTLSLGYFQDYHERFRHVSSSDAPIVRRPSGGGGILHDLELTYSVAVPKNHCWAATRLDFYRMIHGTLIEILGNFGISARFHGDSEPSRKEDGANLPFLCFQRRTPFDIVCGEHKVVGSAQYKRSSGFIQHGSILFERSPLAPELPGLSEITNKTISPEEFSAQWLEKLGETLSARFLPLIRTEKHSVRIAAFEQNKFLSESWNKKLHSRRPVL